VAWAGLAHATIHFVPDDFANLQMALDESNSNDTVICRAGTYRGPFFIWARNITIASEFLLSENPGDIASCIVRPANANPEDRCFETQHATRDSVTLRIVGMTIQGARNIGQDNYGGGIIIRRRIAEIRDCIFKANLAVFGGAVHADSSVVRFHDCLFQGNDAVRQGRCLSGYRSEFYLYDCDIGPSGYLIADEHRDAEIELRGTSIQFTRTRIHDLGMTPEGWVEFISCYNGNQRLPYIRFDGCVIENNVFPRFFQCNGHNGPNEFAMDSCMFANNSQSFSFWNPAFTQVSATVTITRCLFEGNTVQANTAGVGFFYYTGSRLRFVVEDNTFRNNYNGQSACLEVSEMSGTSIGRIQRNYFIGNSSLGYPTYRSRTITIGDVGEGVVEYNAFLDNIGDAVNTSDFYSPTSYALHNWWGDSTGPYEETRNLHGLGDTTNAATIYDDWLMSEEEIPDTSLFPPNDARERVNLPTTWAISNVYPNPFNSEFRVELVGLAGTDFEVRLYNLLGREVALLHSGRTLGGTLSFQAPPNLAAGLYFLRANDRTLALAKKVLLLK